MTDTRSQVIDDSSKASQLVVDNSSETTKLYDTIYQSLFELQATTDPDGKKRNVKVLKPDFNNVKLRNIILMLLLANNAKLDSNVAFKLESDIYFALQQQLMENNHGRELSKEQNISFKKQKGSEVHYVNLLSGLKIRANDLTFIFNRDTKSFNTIIEIAKKYQLELPEDIDNQETFTEFEILFNTVDSMRLCQEIININPSFTPDNNSYSSFISEVMLPIITQLAYTGIQNTSPELITKIISGQYNNIIQQRIAQLLNDALQNNQTLPELTLNNLLDEDLVRVYDIKSFIDSEYHTDKDKKEKLKEAIEIAMKNKNIEVSKVVFQIIKKYQEYTIQSICDKLRELYPDLTINDKYKEYIGNIISYSFSSFFPLSDLNNPLVCLNNILPLSDLNNPLVCLNNILDENLVKVCDIKSFIDSEYHTDKDKKEKLKEAIEIAMKNKNIEVSKVVFQIINKYQEYTIQSICDKLRKLYPDLTINDKYKERINNIIILYLTSNNLSDYLSNLLDENLVNVYNIAELFNDLEKHPLTDWQIKQINQILSQINTERATNDISTTKGMLAQVKNRRIDFALSNEEKQDLTEKQIQQKLKKQIDQICGMVEVAEIARTTENPEVLEAIMKQECFKSDLNILFAILNNKIIDKDILNKCTSVLKDIGANSKDSEIQKQIIDGIIKIFENEIKKMSNIKNLNLNIFGYIHANSKIKEIQKQCINVLWNIGVTSEDSKIQKQSIKEIIGISNKENIDQDVLLVYIKALWDIGVKFEDQEIQKQIIDIIIGISKKGNINQNIFLDCIKALWNIDVNSKHSEIQKQCIKEIIGILNKVNIDENILPLECIYNLWNIGVTSEDPKIQEQSIKEIIGISNNENINQNILFKCIGTLRSIGRKSGYPKEIQEQIINGIIRISNKGNNHRNILLKCIQALCDIGANSKDSKIQEQCIYTLKNIYEKSENSEIQKQIIDGIIKIFKNEIEKISNNKDPDQGILLECIIALGSLGANSEIQKIQEQDIKNIIEISKNKIERISKDKDLDLDMLCKYILALGSVGANSKDQKIQKQIIDIIIGISNNENINENILLKCIKALYIIGVTSEYQEIQKQCIEEIIGILNKENIDQNILLECMTKLRYIGERSEYSEIQERCIKEITKIFKNEIEKISNNKDPDQDILLECIIALGSLGANSEIQKIQEQHIEKIIEISKNKIEKISKDKDLDSDMLCKCILALGSVGANSEDSKTQKQCIKEIKEISENEIIKKLKDKYAVLIIFFKYIGALRDIGVNSEDSKIQKQCIEAIIGISQNPKANQLVSDSGLPLKKYYEEALKGLGYDVSNEQSQNETQGSGYTESKKEYPESSTATNVSNGNNQSNNNENQPVVQPVAQSNNRVDNQSKKEQGNTENGGMQFGK